MSHAKKIQIARGGRCQMFNLRLCSCSKILNPDPDPVSSEISDLCEISDVLLFVCYFDSETNGLTLAIAFLMCGVSFKTFWFTVRYPQQSRAVLLNYFKKGPVTNVKNFRGRVTPIKLCECDMSWMFLTKKQNMRIQCDYVQIYKTW